ncbi:hypothetical protein H0H92_010783 [Tricholoma furcatifolium]|nr:hypothetical protein H0H92_010783 [Tricholoma furcatifolium]
MNINDPAGVKALLDQLRVSQAWKDAVAPQVVAEPTSSPPESSSLGTSSGPSTPSVASLLSQLQSSEPEVHSQRTVDVIDVTHATSIEPAQPFSTTLRSENAPIKKTQDLRYLTFQQALPHLAQLAEDSRFVATVRQLKQEQDDLERQLWEDRRDIIKKYEEKVKVALTKANMFGDSGLSKHEADMLQDGLKKALGKFDRERVLVAWDGLISKQQAILFQHNVPTMFSTSQPADREYASDGEEQRA